MGKNNEGGLQGIEVDTSVYEDYEEKQEGLRDEKSKNTFWHTRNYLIRQGLLKGELDPNEEEDEIIDEEDEEEEIIFKQLRIW